MKIIKILGISIIRENLFGHEYLSFEHNGDTYLQFTKIEKDYCISIYRTKTSQYEIGFNNKKFYAHVATQKKLIQSA